MQFCRKKENQRPRLIVPLKRLNGISFFVKFSANSENEKCIFVQPFLDSVLCLDSWWLYSVIDILCKCTHHTYWIFVLVFSLIDFSVDFSVMVFFIIDFLSRRFLSWRFLSWLFLPWSFLSWILFWNLYLLCIYRIDQQREDLRLWTNSNNGRLCDLETICGTCFINVWYGKNVVIFR